MEGPNSFTLIRPSLVTTGKDIGKTKEVHEGYFSNIEAVVKKVVMIKLHNKNRYEESTMTLQAFLADYARFTNQFSKLLQRSLAKIEIPVELEKLK
jgi:uncharacterized protein YdgA (DUF945 family)